MRSRLFAGLLCLALFPVSLLAQPNASEDPILSTMSQEMNRSLGYLKKQPLAPYFLSYELTDNHAINVSSSFGAITGRSDRRTRLLDIDLRVGRYDMDNSHAVRGDFAMTTFGQLAGRLPLDDDPKALAAALWLETDRHYKEAVQRLAAVKTKNQIKKETEDDSPDFSSAPAEHHFEPIAQFSFDRASWEQRLRRYGVLFRDLPDVQSADIWASGELETRRYTNNDGSEIRMSLPLYRLNLSASIKAPDGEVLPLYRQFMSFTPEGLPDDAQVLKVVGEMKSMLLALRQAPAADAYTGPAILSGRASAVFFHEIFGHRVEADRLKNDDDAQTFKKKINQPILPPFLSVYSDPTLHHLQNSDLVGYYPYDDEGVEARRVTVIDHGIFRSFLMSRSPINGFPSSNGHGRRQQGYDVAARQSNLIVESTKSVSRDKLKSLLIERVKAAHKPYGLLFDDITGGYTFTSRDLPNSFAVLPTVVYRIYPDGREELVRGLDLIGTPLIAFSKISAADNDVGIFNGICGGESGWVPVSAIAPGLLIDQIEVQRKPKSQAQDPILPAPGAAQKKEN